MKFTHEEVRQLDGRDVRIKRDGFWVAKGTILKVSIESFDYQHIGVKWKSSYVLKFFYATTYGYLYKEDMGDIFELV